MQPRILVANNANNNYPEAVTQSGAIAIAKQLPEISTDYDGLLLCGGSDVDPVHYGQPIAGSVNINPERDANELALARAFIAAKKPILGICRGHQVLNIALGGTLHQHIPTAESHRGPGDAVHEVIAEEPSLFTQLYGSRFFTNSSHHQAVDQPGDGLKVLLRCPEDGTVEAFCHETLPILGVQFHPERMCLSRAREDTVNGLPIFRWFTALCQAAKTE